MEENKKKLEEAKKYLSNEGYGKGSNFTLDVVTNLMIEWQQEQDKNKYSEEEVIDILVEFSAEMKNISNITKWFEQFKKK
jgi:hypothetical protein